MGNTNSSENSHIMVHLQTLEDHRRRRRQGDYSSSVPDLESITADESFSSHDGSLCGSMDDASPTSRKNIIPFHWNVRLRSVDQSHTDCPVCAKEFEPNMPVALLPCGHYFCKACIQEWMNMTEQNCTCPLCRHDLKAARSTLRELHRCEERNETNENDHIFVEPQRLINMNIDELHKTNLVTTYNGLDRNFDLIMAKMLNVPKSTSN